MKTTTGFAPVCASSARSAMIRNQCSQPLGADRVGHVANKACQATSSVGKRVVQQEWERKKPDEKKGKRKRTTVEGRSFAR